MIRMKKLFVVCLTILLTACATTDKVTDQLYSTTIQNTLAYLDKNDIRYISIQRKQATLAKDYLNHWFSPWTDHYWVNSLAEIKTKITQVFEELLNYPGINFNQHPHTPTWIKNIVENANWEHFPNLNMEAITIQNVHTRNVPTNTPSFNSLTAAGQWYPFDNIQGSIIAANVPVKVLHVSRDGLWYFILTTNCYGWIPHHAVAFVDSQFIKRWQTGRYVMATQENVPAFNDKSQLLLKTRMGVLYPINRTSKYYYNILVATCTFDQKATIQIARLRKKHADRFPMPIHPKNIAALANKMLGSPYDWGNKYGYRDCSATQMDLFAPFGIWLPRNSTQQVKKGGQLITLTGLPSTEKEKRIIQQAIPFLTLIHKSGHIMLYIGHLNHQIYVFHTMWGLKTKSLLGREGSAVVGRTVITPLRFGQHYLNVPHHLLDQIDSMVLLTNVMR
jgi:hypothetical protein